MASYVRFSDAQSADGKTDTDTTALLIEVAPAEIVVRADGGAQKAGLREVVQGAIGQANQSLRDVISTAVRFNAEAFLAAIDSLPQRPSSAEFSFVLKVTGEASNVAVGKIGGEANYSVKLVWTRE